MTTTDTYASIDIAYLTTCRPGCVTDPRIDQVCTVMRSEGRTELVHYAGAMYRDEVAYALVLAWLAAPALPESELKARALNATGYGPVTAHDIHLASGGTIH